MTVLLARVDLSNRFSSVQISKYLIATYICLVKLILPISSNCVLTVINASAAVTLLEQRPEKIQALSGIRTQDLCIRIRYAYAYDRSHVALIAQLGEHCTGIAEVVGSNPAQSLNFFRSLFK